MEASVVNPLEEKEKETFYYGRFSLEATNKFSEKKKDILFQTFLEATNKFSVRSELIRFH
jgi:hypothetical protein